MMGLSNAISQKQLSELHAQIQKLQSEKLDVERDLSIKENQFKAQVNKVKDEKQAIEKQLYDTEFLLGDKERELQK
jgi:replicative DNA helicase